MPKRSRLFLAAILSVVLGFYPLLAPPAHRIDQAHFESIFPGMTRTDVESLFGVPPGEYDWAEADGPAWPVLYLSVPMNANVPFEPLRFPQARDSDIRWQLLAAPKLPIGWEQTQSTTLLLNNAAFWDPSGSPLWNPWGPTPPTSIWTSKHGSFTVVFDREDRVAAVGGPAGVHLVPPWQRWWRAWKK